ncbi:MAG: hypothetical protein P0S96_05720 [Simkaniaceae bacterium]|nr:hypothetical protein [Candidatus Sacchlamyda saccharinae]
MAKSFILASSLILFTAGFANGPLTPKEITLGNQPEKKAQRKSPMVKASFSPFTGKVIGDKVRMRLQPDLDSHVVREVAKNDMIAVIAQEGDYYSVEPPASLKAYIFRSFVLDGVVEGNRVNVRLEPDLEAPVIGHLNSGDRINGDISQQNRKWLEIAPPSNTHFYIAKEFIEYAGGPELKEKMAQRKETAEQLLEAARLFAKSELENTFEEINFEKIKEGFLTVIHDFTDFPQKAELAKEALTGAQEEYLQKRIAYLEEKAALASDYVAPQGRKAKAAKTLESKTWRGVEEGLFAAWQEHHQEKSINEFYDEQKIVATSVTGVLEAFTSPVQNKPGNYIVKNKNLPVAYVYSTSVNLEDFVGQEVTLIGSSRDNHNFAFPAYFVHEVE